MKKWVLMLGVSFLCFSSFATDYELGVVPCINFEEVEETYIKGEPSEVLYAQCLLIKGKLVGDESLVEEGTEILKRLSDQEDSIVASFIYGFFHYSEGTFGNIIAFKNLKLVEKYLIKTLKNINDDPTYPSNEEYVIWERDKQIEMRVYSMLPTVYLQMYFLNLLGEFRLLSSENKYTYPEYRDESDTYYINLAKTHAENCRDLPIKGHFDETAELFKKVCAMTVERIEGTEDIKGLEKIQGKRKVVLENECSEDVSKKACSKIYELNDEFFDIYKSIFREANEILKEGGYLFHAASSG